jgi:PAS domain S-box-containing protein
MKKSMTMNCRLTNRLSELRQVEAELKNVLGEMELRVEDRTRELKRSNEALIFANQQLNDIIGFLPDATFVIDSEKKVVAWNRAMEEMTGVSKEDMIGKGGRVWTVPFYGEVRKHLLDLLDTDDPELASKYRCLRRKGNVISAETFLPCVYGGRGAYVFAMGAPLFDAHGNRAGAIESIRDVTEQKLAQDALALAEEKYRCIFENALMGIFQVSTDGRIISANPAFARILGYDSPEELLNSVSNFPQQICVYPDCRSKLLRLTSEQDFVQEFELQFHRQDGSIAWMSINIRSVRDRSGEIAFLEGTAQDISTRKDLESQLFQAQKMEAIGTLAGGIAHDFNNILGAIVGFIELTKLGMEGKKQLGYMDQALKACDRARDLIRRILTFSRTGKQEKKPIDLASLIEDTLKMLRATLPATIEISPIIALGVSGVIADRTQINRVILNLCTNAAQAMHETGGVLTINLANCEIDPNSTHHHPDLPPGPYVRLSVSDTGVGIDPILLNRIFDPFFSTKEKGQGTGLGLSVVYGIIKDCGGTVTVQSKPGEGSMFTVYLPAVPGEIKSKSQSSEEIPTGTESILFVDDEAILVEMGRDMLSNLGYSVTATTDSIEALETFRDHPGGFDLVFTDMTMPKMTGLGLAREIQRIRPEIPIILSTGFSDLVDDKNASELGISKVLMKPFSMKDMAGIIRKALDEPGQ